jgi:hypothetical protein
MNEEFKLEWSRGNGSCIYNNVFSDFLSFMGTWVLHECAFLVVMVARVFFGRIKWGISVFHPLVL